MSAISEKLHNSWQIFKRSVQVMRDHPKLLVFPIITGVLTSMIAFFFLAPVGLVLLAPHWIQGGWMQGLADSIGFVKVQNGHNYSFQIQPFGSAILAGIYLMNMFLATMASVAFNSEIIEALGGREVSIRHGLAVACSRWKAVLLWSLLAGVVGLIIRNVEERFALVGRIVAGLIGLAWSVASIFTIPILVREPETSNPFKLLSKSANLIKQTWGEMLAGYLGMSGCNLLFLWASILLWVGTAALCFMLSNFWLMLGVGLVWLAAFVTYSYLASIASRVYLCALYLYASEGTVPDYYDSSMMNTAWKLKKGAA